MGTLVLFGSFNSRSDMSIKKAVWILLLVFGILFGGCTSPQGTPPPASSEPPTSEPVEAPTQPVGRDPLVIEDGKLYVAIIWHQHQPVYLKDPQTGIYERPWVRVHAAKDYLDMAAMLQDYPEVHATFNLTPSLIRQLDDISAGAKDLYWVHAEIPASELTDAQKQFLLDRFFDINSTIIARFPRYAELAARRDAGIDAWSEQDFRDLQVLFNLAWTDPDWLARPPLDDLVARGRDFEEQDKQVLFDEHLRMVREVIPLHAAMQEAGQIEVTMTPYTHPILPLLVDSDLASIAMPDADLPTRFVYGQDAVAQVDLGVQFYQDHFGVQPRGMWPAEGSVAEPIVSMIANAGIRWIATDEDVLANSLPDFAGFTRDSSDTLQQADILYRPYLVQGGRGGPVTIIFRDHLISDKVGFEYSGMDGELAAQDFINRLINIKNELAAEGAQGPHLVTVLLDGENAWEYYENDGKAFLNALYRQLSERDDMVTVTPSEYLDALAASGAEPLREIDELWAGSWIDGTFSTWIGEEEENLAWEYLRRVRDDLQDAITGGELDESTLQNALDLMYIAEGSDWFWWYGADQNSGADDSFDRQFRGYLEQVYQAIGQPVPDFVYVPVIPQTAQEPDQQPLDQLSITLDGAAGDGEWASAGVYTLTDSGPYTAFYYGFDQSTFYLRVDAPEGFDEAATLGFYLSTPLRGRTNAYSRFGESTTTLGFGVKQLLEVTFEGGQPTAAIYKADGEGGWELYAEDLPTLDTLAAGDGLLEIALPFERFAPDIRSGDRINIRLVASQVASDLAVIPSRGPAAAVVPDLPIPNVFMELSDPAGDDYGPGTYQYPGDAVFRGGAYDITEFVAGYDETEVIFRVQFRGPVENVWGSPNGLSIQTVDIYIDADGHAAGARLLLPGRNAALPADYAWDVALWAEGWTPGIYQPGSEGPVQVNGSLTIVGNPGQRRVTIRVPRSLLPAGSPEDWQYAVVVLSQEGYPSAGVWRVRNVQPDAEQWRIGGGTGSNLDTRIMDVLWPEGSLPDQTELLSNPQPGAALDLSGLPPDGYPIVPMLAP